MSDAFRAEFTGERVIPGRVEDNLFNEHMARYRFAARLVSSLRLGGAFLDAGCGAGYGTAELAKSGAEVVGIDVSAEAIGHAYANYGAGAGLRFEQASCTAIPAEAGAFQLITAFEVIEHLAEWRGFLGEARRVLAPGGLFLVSTPNRLYYAESRKKAGPNPFHVHEFTEGEFRRELELVFPHVKILLQNHVEGIALAGAEAQGVALEISDRAAEPADAHFFLAVCGMEPLPRVTGFVFIPESGNVLQTRERHIALLDGEIRQKNEWIRREQAERNRMLEKVREMEAELEEHNRWARKANEEAERRAQLVAALQEELRRSNEWAKRRDAEAVAKGKRVEELQREVAQATAWAKTRDAEAEERGQRVVELQAEVATATAWAETETARLEQELATIHRDADERGRRIVELQEESQRERENMAAGYEAAIEQWRREKEASDRWAMETEMRLSGERDAAREAFTAKEAEFENSLQQIAALEVEKERLGQQLTEARRKLELIAQSRWVRLGRAVRVGPEIEPSQS